MSAAQTTSPNEVLEQFKLADDIYVLGIFEPNLTIYNQQVRALNLVWAMVQSGSSSSLQNVAVIGGGFAGLTAAAGLLQKGIPHVSLFEKRATLLPLQQGSDARWVHPQIYDWPDDGSELPTAALPLLNWNAGRASDAVVEVLRQWEGLVQQAEKSGANPVEVFVNVKHLRLNENREIEWVGEKLQTNVGSTTSGNKKRFDRVVIAVGFGLERNARFSYWRNETLGQPQLDLGKRTYLISGHGDGALVDLFRIRIARFRQDRILAELFGKKPVLVEALRGLRQHLAENKIKPEELYDRFEAIAGDRASGFDSLLSDLRGRLRADTAAVLRMSAQTDSFKRVFASRTSFQNRFLLFALYYAGGVIPTRYKKASVICEEYGIRKKDIIRRHGTDRPRVLEEILENSLAEKSKKRIKCLSIGNTQTAIVCWPGGYWHEPAENLGWSVAGTQDGKAKWRKEYLPSATEVLVTGFIASVAGYLGSSEAGNDFRVTFHRTLYVGPEILLQQAARYLGPTERFGDAGRVFKFSEATIGYAGRIKKIVRTRFQRPLETDKEYAAAFQRDTTLLEVEKHSQRMASEVRSLIALPILISDKSSVLGVLFADSTKPNVFSDDRIKSLINMCQLFTSEIEKIYSPRVRNFQISLGSRVIAQHQLNGQLEVIESLNFELPCAKIDYLNLEFTDFITLHQGEN